MKATITGDYLPGLFLDDGRGSFFGDLGHIKNEIVGVKLGDIFETADFNEI